MTRKDRSPGRTGRTAAAIASLGVALASLTGCIPSFRSRDALAFKDIPYTAADGTPWPSRTLRLPEAEKVYKLGAPLEVSYVEINPGGKAPIVFIHGLGSNLKFWRYQLDHFAKRGHRVVALDLPGYGKSVKPATFPYTMESFADVVREAVKALGIERPILVGHSMGGHTALSYGIRWPDEPRALVLTAPAGFEEFSRRDKDWFKRAVTVRFIKSADEYRIWGSIRHNNFHRWRPEYTWLVEERVRLAKAADFDSYAYANLKSIHGLLETDFIRKNLGRIKAPTLIVYGDKDALIPNPFLHGGFASDVMSFGHKGIAGSKLTELTGCGHMVQMDCADRYNESVHDFLAVVEKTTSDKAPAGAPGSDVDKAAAEKVAAEKLAAEKLAAEKAAAEKAAFDKAVAAAVAERLTSNNADFEKAVAAAVAERLAAAEKAAAEKAAAEKAAADKAAAEKAGAKKQGGGQVPPKKDGSQK